MSLNRRATNPSHYFVIDRRNRCMIGAVPWWTTRS